MTCAHFDELLTRWRLFTVFEPESSDATTAHTAIGEHMKSCEVCKDEVLVEILNQIGLPRSPSH